MLSGLHSMETLLAALGKQASVAVQAGGKRHSYADLLRASARFAALFDLQHGGSRNGSIKDASDGAIDVNQPAHGHTETPGSFPAHSRNYSDSEQKLLRKGHIQEPFEPFPNSASFPELQRWPASLDPRLRALLYGEALQEPLIPDNPFLSVHVRQPRRLSPSVQGTVYREAFRLFSTQTGPLSGRPLWLQDGQRVGIFGQPSAEFVAALWGTWRAGGVAVPLATSHPPAELLYVMQDSEVSVVAGPEEQRNLLEPLAQQCSARFVVLPPVTTSASPSCTGAAHEGGLKQEASIEDLMVESAPTVGQVAAMLIYTSGTTGRPKGAVHTHASLAAQARMLAEAWEYHPTDRMLHCLPLHHVHGLVNALIAPLSVGASVELLPRFSPAAIWKSWRESYPDEGPPGEGAITMFTGVPTMYVRLLQAFDAMAPWEQQASARAAGRLRLMMCGSAALPSVVMERWEAVTGHQLLERYGMTELGMALSNPLQGERRPGFVGVPFKGEEVKIVPEEDSGGPGPSRVGELRVKSPGMFREYWRKPEATRREFDLEGFFKTGDTATVENGYYKILGRASVDIVKSGGYKLSALELEALLLEHPLIGECAVFGVPDKEYGEQVAAVVALRANGRPPGGEQPAACLTLEELREWARNRMAPYKMPTKLRVVDALPKNAMGKVNKKELRKQLFGL